MVDDFCLLALGVVAVCVFFSFEIVDFLFAHTSLLLLGISF